MPRELNYFVFLNVIYAFASTSSLFKYLRRRYDHLVVHELNRLLRLKGHYVRTVEQIAFLRNCLAAYVTPLHIKKRVQKAKPKHPFGIERAFLRDELNKYQDFLNQAVNDYRLTLPVIRRLSLLDRLRFCKLLNLTAVRLRERVKTQKDNALAKLRRNQLGEGVLDHSVIVNLAGIELSDYQKDVLCRGLNFGVPPKRRDFTTEVYAEFELCWDQLERLVPVSEDERRCCKNALTGLAERYAHEKVDKSGYPLKKEHFEAISELKKDKNLVITRPDKGNGVVIMKRSDYVQKMLDILSQEDKFRRIGDADTNDSTVQQERALQALLLRACKNNHITRETYEEIRPVGSTRPRMYGLPKVHKAGVPLRPILSMVNAPQHAMARWLSKILQPVLNKFSDHTVKDSFSFCSNLERFEQETKATETYMCSFDVVSLFTNIPLADTIQICVDTLYRDENLVPPTIPETLFRKLLMKATTEVEFSFDGVIYQQIDGVAMGSPLGPVLANIFVGYCESKVQPAQWPLLYDRFVDDSFALFNNEGESQEFFRVLNDLHPALRFTVEGEVDNRLPFLDVMVQRLGEHFLRSVHRKATFSGLYARWDSFGPRTQKIAVIRSLTWRAVRICSAGTLPQELVKLKELFGKNGYPEHIVEQTIQETLQRSAEKQNGAEEAERLGSIPEAERVFLRLPWLGNVSVGYRRQFSGVVTRCFPQVRPQVLFSTCSAFNGRKKDALPATARSFVVYEYTCSCGLTYVGRTSQCLSARIKQHIPLKLLDGSNPGRISQSDSAILKHLKSNRECLRDDLHTAFRILAQARSDFHLGVLEALFIQRLAPTLCCQKEHVRVLSLF